MRGTSPRFPGHGLVLVSIVAPLAIAVTLQGQTTRTEIDYTGSLMGYYRMEYNESSHLPPVKSFLDYRQNSSTLLLGMGDNFGPEFGASLQLENGTHPGADAPCYLPPNATPTRETRPESLYKDDNRIAPRAECDNVLNFLMHAGFRAVVPGIQDFMYTARWLRNAAVLLDQADTDPEQSAEIHNPDRKVHILAANLRIAMRGAGGARCPLLFSPNPAARDAVSCGDSGDAPEPLNWLDRLDRLARGGDGNPTAAALRELATESALEARGRQSELDTLVRDEIAIFNSAWGLRFSLPALPAAEHTKQEQNGGPQGLTSAQARGLAAAIDGMKDCPAPAGAGDQAEMCAYAAHLSSILNALAKLVDEQSKESGAEMTPAMQAERRAEGAALTLTAATRKDAIDGLLRTVAAEENNIGYTVAQTATGQKILILGVVGQDTLDAVSATNLRLCLPSAGNSAHAFAPCGTRSGPGGYGEGATVMAVDPVTVTEAMVRGAELTEGHFDAIVLMAQMPHTEAEILAERVWKRLNLDGAQTAIDVVLSEAQSGYGTPQMTLNYAASPKPTHAAPVLTPEPSYSARTGSYPGAVARLDLQHQDDKSISLTNQPNGIFSPPAVSGSDTTISLLYQLVTHLKSSLSSQLNTGADLAARQKAAFALLEDLRNASQPRADVVLLQSRDIELNAIGTGYTGYEMCQDETENPSLCQLRSALDRIFWKGDYLEYVAVTGKDLKEILGLSQNKMAEQAQLAENGPTGEWLVSFGIVQSGISNLTEISQNNEPLWIPVDPSCKAASRNQSTYCIGGTPIADDAYYWVLTTDQLAQDKAVYGTLQKLPSANHKATDSFVTAPLSHFLLASLQGSREPAAALTPLAGPPERVITAGNVTFQQMPLWQIDFAKLIVDFTSRHPVGGNQFVGGYFQGVSDARASAPAQQDLDLELGERVTGNPLRPDRIGHSLAPISVGMQSSFNYNRSVLGNLSPSTKPINAVYSLNNLIVGGFVQVRLDGKDAGDGVRSVRSLPRDLLVFTPHQFQVEINTPYLFFPFAASSPVPGELTVQLPRISGWTDRAGFRREFGQEMQGAFFGNGSYFETGMEFNLQNNVLSAITLKTGAAQKTCQVSATLTLQTCFSQAPALPINNSTVLVGYPAVKALHAPGVYWDIRLQNRIFGSDRRQVSLVTETQGDYYFGRPVSAELPTQTEYAIPLSLSLNFPSLGNLTFAPTYSMFFYQSQLSSQSLLVNSFSLAARWYFARDARVPVHRQFPLPGPPSANQTGAR